MEKTYFAHFDKNGNQISTSKNENENEAVHSIKLTENLLDNNSNPQVYVFDIKSKSIKTLSKKEPVLAKELEINNKITYEVDKVLPLHEQVSVLREAVLTGSLTALKKHNKIISAIKRKF